MSDKTFDEKFTELLKTHKDFVDSDTGELLRERIKRDAYDFNKDLITLLLSDDTVSAEFFEEIAGRWIFDNNKFVAYLNDVNFLHKSYTKFKNKIGLNIDGKYLQERGKVSLVWPYKDCILEGGQTKEQRKQDEIFFNEIIAPDEINQMFDPKVLTNWKRHTVAGEENVTEIQRGENDTIRENLIIKGNNLIALHSLRKQFKEKVRLIYIDPPYNPNSPSNTFMYNNNFKRSSWLTFMKNRLEIAKELLTNNGVMIVAIDENEQVYLGVLLDEVFPEHEKHCITIVHNPRGVQGTNFSYIHEYAIFVIPKGEKVIGNRDIPPEEITWDHFRNWGGESKREDAKNCFYPVIVEDSKVIGFGDVLDDNEHPSAQTVQHGKKSFVYPIDQKGIERKWRYARQSADKIKHLLRTKEVERGYEIELGKDFGMYRTVWENKRYDANIYGTQLVKKLVPGCKFDFPKSLWNVYDCLRAVVKNDKEAIILDFFAGSGTTAHAVLELNKQDNGNRKYILIEQMDYIESVTVPRVKKVIEKQDSDDFIYCELKAYNEDYMERIQSAESTEQLLKIWRKMPRKSILNWYINPKAPEQAEEEFIKIDDLDKQKQELMKQLDKNQLYINLSEISDETHGVSESDKQLNTDFHATKGDDESDA